MGQPLISKPQFARMPVRKASLVLMFSLQVVLGMTDASANQTTSIRMLDYWPTFSGYTTLIKHISTDFYGQPFEGMRSIYRGQSQDRFTKQDYIFKSKGRFRHNDTWYLRREGDLLVEYRDDLQISAGAEPVRVIYRKGKEIKWGGAFDTSPGRNAMESHIVVDANVSDPFFVTSVPSKYGYASTRLEAVLPSFAAGPYTYENVAVLHHYQTMCLDKSCDANAPVYNSKGKQIGGAQSWEIRYWMAPQKGIIQTQYLKTSNVRGDPTKGRIDYVSRMCNGTKSQQACAAD
jgi:hypothetical protein